MIRMRKALYLALATLFLAVPGKSEVVFFKNGDRLTGHWVRVTTGGLIFHGEAIGDVTIPASKIKSFEAPKPAVALLEGGQTIRGKLSLGPTGRWEIESGGETHSVTASALLAIYPEEFYKPRSSQHERKPWQSWKGGGNFGYSLVRGDLQAGTASISFNATRKRPNLPGLPEHLRTHFMMTMLLANTRSLTGVRTSANSFTTGLRQDYLFTPTNFVFVLGQMDHVEAQSLNLRQTYGTGLGHDLLRSHRTAFSFLGGTTYVKENFQHGVARENAEGLLGERLGLQLSGRLRLDHLFNFYPSLTAGGEFRADSTTTFSAKISPRLSLTTGFTDRYLSNPLSGHMRNELVMTTGLGFSF